MESKKELMSDQRFSRITKDPRFWEMPEKERKIKIDRRFQAMFHDKKFKLKYTVDKRGRPVYHSSTEDLKRFYDLSDSDLSDSSHKLTEKKPEREKTKAEEKRGSEKSSVDSSSGGERKGTGKSILKNESHKSKSSKSKKTVRGIQVFESPPEKELEPKQQNKQGGNSAEKQKTVKKKAVKGHSIESYVTHKRTELANEDDSSGSHINENCLENESCKNEESFDLEEMESSEEIEEESASEDGGDLEEESNLGHDGGMREESDSENEVEGNQSETDDGESDSGPDLARGKGNIESSSEDEEEEDLTEIFPKEPEVVHEWGELAKDAPRGDKITCRLAVCNMDWDRLKAKDLLALFNSFTPKGGVIFSVKIYPSEFGKERMKEEEMNGPTELLSLPEDVTEKDRWDGAKGEQLSDLYFHSACSCIFKEKLRDYQFKRLKYFYAVIECDSPETANKIYEECDGLEFESSCSFVDLRFIPDDVTFDDEPKDVASEMDGAAYKPKYFTSAAVATSKVDITWDEMDHERMTYLSKTFKKDELLDMEFQAYLASSSEEEEEEEQQDCGVKHMTDSDKHKHHPKDDEEQIAKYRELLRSIQEKEKKHQETEMEMEIKWVPGLKESAEEMVRNKMEGKDKLTPWEQFLEKKKEKRKLKKKQKAAAEETLNEDECPPDVNLNDPYFAEELGKAGLNKKLKKEENNQDKKDDTEKHKAEMALLVMDDEEDERRHFNYDKIVEQQNLSKKKKKLLMKKKELLTDDFQVNVADARFQAMYTSHLFNLDPSDPNFKKTKAVEKILEEKARRREKGFTEAIGREDSMAETAARKSVDSALSMLIKSVKNKTEQFQARKKQKVK